MDQFTILNYQGSKKNLLQFIHTNAASYIDPQKAILDIFSGSCSVGYSYKSQSQIIANDSEAYSAQIAKALLSPRPQGNYPQLKEQFTRYYQKNMKKLKLSLHSYWEEEERLLSLHNYQELTALYHNYPTIFNGKVIAAPLADGVFSLFSSYYAGTYFGIYQASSIDSIRFAIEHTRESLKPILFASLYFAIKESVFAKDGHMAQPLDPAKNVRKLILQRSRKISLIFWEKCKEFFSEQFVDTAAQNQIFQLDFRDLIKRESVMKQVGFIYADPPYTDMQYSRYYHLLNVVTRYDYPAPTVLRGKYTKGLYTEHRYQSRLSQKASCYQQFMELVSYSKRAEKNLAVSFAYPLDPQSQKVDRYVMSIDQITNGCIQIFGARRVEVCSVEYTHSNNRNSAAKNVLEYLVLCRGKNHD